ncbi:MAG: YkgJ family cysteine cluster protein [Microcoleaceae cyanobacterium]
MTNIWQCAKHCGACCQLNPTERPDLEEYLSPEELEHYLSLVGLGGWCIHFNHGTRECGIYAERPQFCRVESESFQRMYGVKPEELDEFAIFCCREQISSVYGSNSEEMARFNQGIESEYSDFQSREV